MQTTGDGGSHREVCGVAAFFYINHLQLAGEQWPEVASGSFSGLSACGTGSLDRWRLAL